MGHLNVLKGAYPSLSQLDETLPVKTGEAVERGSALVKDNGEWALTVDADAGVTGTPGKIVYFALQDADDPDVNMAKGLTALPCIAPCEIETDQYSGTPTVGSYIRCADNGKVTKLENAGGEKETAIGMCTKAAGPRWSNNDGPNAGFPGERTGGLIQVIAFWTCYIPEVTAL